MFNIWKNNNCINEPYYIRIVLSFNNKTTEIDLLLV